MFFRSRPKTQTAETSGSNVQAQLMPRGKTRKISNIFYLKIDIFHIQTMGT